ncbi:YihA family ribosome biogenesis GTP-binding protein [Alloprevotella sp. OH1205_COT-284]|uniref:ribosome biogenesis GTP-binding protein YihA/YsxC n=1 Tax=Alloprevotella sp. OH1205_COT-284 TaxID=2491043 RepID=UPI000F60345B|nr:ribosome biogenesis GTP-binding protein YihA/YsxC [Alloprevotella sp. OH1205_COT-284]RRD80663.1 YihA family ribosome biogenesis GTP-binding protein [Alloprevotella sp. OH1205_COT-284]
MIIKSADFFISSSRADQCPQDPKCPEYAFIGRSNVGKSSLINMLTGRKALAMTSATPGKTMLINHFLINKAWFLVDLPGYGYAKRGKKDVEKLRNLIEHYVLDRKQLTSLFVLIDSRLPPQQIDLEFIEWLGEEGIPFAIVFTKADKNKRNDLKKNIDVFLDTLRRQWEELPPHFVTSSEKGEGREEVLSYIDSINHELDQ